MECVDVHMDGVVLRRSTSEYEYFLRLCRHDASSRPQASELQPRGGRSWCSRLSGIGIPHIALGGYKLDWHDLYNAGPPFVFKSYGQRVGP